MKYHSTHILEILIWNKLLKDRLNFLFHSELEEIETYLRRIHANRVPSVSQAIQRAIPTLLKYGYISRGPSSEVKGPGSLMFNDVLNFELTYSCQLSCSHCLQSQYRARESSPLPTKRVLETIKQGYLAGLCRRGINFTGGEVLGNRDDLFEILDYTNFLGIPYRLNTNSWWAGKKNLSICGRTFPDPADLVAFLKSKGLAMFAFSFDERYLNEKHDKGGLIKSIGLCEQAKLPYQLIFTGIKEEQQEAGIALISKLCGHRLNYLIPINMEMVDIGKASDSFREKYSWQKNKAPFRNCFFRPSYIHISPQGKVRTCIYANGLANVGDIQTHSFTELINRFPYVKSNAIFASTEKRKEHERRLVEPYQNNYKPIVHECTKKIILAKTFERLNGFDETALEDIHFAIAKEMNLLQLAE